jgi:hypothetical protein
MVRFIPLRPSKARARASVSRPPSAFLQNREIIEQILSAQPERPACNLAW